MFPKGWKAVGALTAVLAALLPGAGCSKSDVIGSTVGTLTVQVRASGGTTTRFAAYIQVPNDPNDPSQGTHPVPVAFWTISGVGFQPTDPAQRDVLGGQSLTVSKKAVTFELGSSTPVVIDTTTLSQNSFTITKLSVTSLQLGPGTPVEGSSSCLDQVVTVPPQPLGLDVLTFNPPLVFQVPVGTVKVTLDIDVPKLTDAYLNSFTSCNAGTLVESDFDAARFAQGLSSGVIRIVQSN